MNTTRAGGFGSPAAPPEVIRDEEVAAMYALIPRSALWGIRAMAMLECMHKMGMRKGEVYRITPDQVDLNGIRPSMWIRKSKFDKGRNVPIDPRALPALRLWAIARPQAETFFCTIQLQHGPVAHGKPVGSRLSHGFLNRMVDSLARQAGITRNLKVHWWRHTCATNWLRGEFTIEEVRYLLGHTSIATTNRYVHAAHADVERKMRELATGGLGDVELVGMKECPTCCEEIKLGASRCRYCGSAVAA